LLRRAINSSFANEANRTDSASSQATGYFGRGSRAWGPTGATGFDSSGREPLCSSVISSYLVVTHGIVVKEVLTPVIIGTANQSWADKSVKHARIQLGREMNFTVEAEQETDGRWIAEVSEMPGVMKYGSTRDEAIAQAEALALRVLADRIEHGVHPVEPIQITFAAA